ncbi:helix-turn-helix domain-containing protein [Pseudemcibacter aquimaris]|uniref:helix-turn-helix domain-containing protein n=1 Tax=Pseudemcibacter aquimaris TaxID=2857064 RepID=UPI0020111B33|nr:helix-turn-helix domain-containing protein [Pseudemcibacter aquimaris]MCC3859708.1 helix-turn-helix domain-containing protein [Pseudemcibacter aquimaris]WDU60103.1 helix-turn-helix domain-containing protein [Pseudemcibacter aquimaris]
MNALLPEVKKSFALIFALFFYHDCYIVHILFQRQAKSTHLVREFMSFIVHYKYMSDLKRLWISRRIAELGKKKKDLAEALGLPHTRISDIINGNRSLKITEIGNFAEFMQMSYTEVLSRFSKKEPNYDISYDSLIPDEKDLIESYRGLSESGKQKFQQMFDDAKDDEEKS